MAVGDEGRAERDGRDEWWEQWERQQQEWMQERSGQLQADIAALPKKVEAGHEGEDEDDDGMGVRVPV
jgi:hypothetical protein